MLKTVETVTEPGYVQCVFGTGCNLVYLYVLQFKRWECGNECSVSSVGLRSLQRSCVSVNRAAASSSVVTSWEVLGEQDEQVSAQCWKHTGQGNHSGFMISPWIYLFFTAKLSNTNSAHRQNDKKGSSGMVTKMSKVAVALVNRAKTHNTQQFLPCGQMECWQHDIN